MIRKASIIKLKPDMQEEYKMRHDEIWPEMQLVLHNQKMRNYSIWLYGNTLFCYWESEDNRKIQMSQLDKATYDRWQNYMKDLIEHVVDPITGEDISLPMMFLFE